MDTPTSPGSPATGAADTARQAVHDLTDKAKEQAGDLAELFARPLRRRALLEV